MTFANNISIGAAEGYRSYFKCRLTHSRAYVGDKRSVVDRSDWGKVAQFI